MSTPRLELSTTEVATILAESARRSVLEITATHPVDLASAMTFAIEYSAEALVIMRDQGLLKWQGSR